MFYAALFDDLKTEPGTLLVDGDRFFAINKQIRFRVKRVGDVVHFERDGQYTALLTDVKRQGTTYTGRFDCKHEHFQCRFQGRFSVDKPLDVHDRLCAAFAMGPAIAPCGYRGSCEFFTELLKDIKNAYEEDVVLFADDNFVSIKPDNSLRFKVQLLGDAVVLEREGRYTARLSELAGRFSGRFEVAFLEHASCSIHGSFEVRTPIYVHGKMSEALMVVRKHADDLALF